MLIWDGLGAHWSWAMRNRLAQQDWLTVEQLPAYAPELNPGELLWAHLKTGELASFAGNHLTELANATESGINRVCNDEPLPWSSPTQD